MRGSYFFWETACDVDRNGLKSTGVVWKASPQVVRMGKHFIKSLSHLKSKGIIEFGFWGESHLAIATAEHFEDLLLSGTSTSCTFHNSAKRVRGIIISVL